LELEKEEYREQTGLKEVEELAKGEIEERWLWQRKKRCREREKETEEKKKQ
jgi:hypothetical protein